MNVLYKIKVNFFDEGSALKYNNNIDSFLLPNEKRIFVKNSWCETSKKTFSETFEELDKNIYLVLKPVVSFFILNSFSITNSDYDDSEMGLSEMININLLWNDIKDNFGNFDRLGQSELVTTIIIKEHWSQCWEGDWDCNHEYIGVIDNKFDEKSILDKKSLDSLKSREVKFKKYIYGI
jgi:hypothetical protein